MKSLSFAISIMILVSYTTQYARIPNPFSNSYKKKANQSYSSLSGLPSYTVALRVPSATSNPNNGTSNPSTRTTSNGTSNNQVVNSSAQNGTSNNQVVNSSAQNGTSNNQVVNSSAQSIDQLVLNLIKNNAIGLEVGSDIQSSLSDQKIKCQGWCDLNPPSPTCDDSNTLYRNKCEVKCALKSESTNNLRYGICCCSDNDFTLRTVPNIGSNETELSYYTKSTINQAIDAENYICISTCIYNCFGGRQLVTDHPDITLSQVTTDDVGCAATAESVLV